jgi:hypothetical protein
MAWTCFSHCSAKGKYAGKDALACVLIGDRVLDAHRIDGAHQPGGVLGVGSAGLEDDLEPDVLERAFEPVGGLRPVLVRHDAVEVVLRVSDSMRVRLSSDWAMNCENSSRIKWCVVARSEAVTRLSGIL